MTKSKHERWELACSVLKMRGTDIIQYASVIYDRLSDGSYVGTFRLDRMREGLAEAQTALDDLSAEIRKREETKP